MEDVYEIAYKEMVYNMIFDTINERYSFFCDNIENAVSFDSLEGLLRIEHRPTPIHTDRAIGRTRLKIKGQNDIFDGLTMFASSNSIDKHIPQ